MARLSLDQDVTLQEIGKRLRESTQIVYPGSVKSFSCFDNIPVDPSMYPHISLWRVQATGNRLEKCTVNLRYMILGQQERQKFPGIFRAVSIEFCKVLSEFPNYLDTNPLRDWYIPPGQTFEFSQKIMGFKDGIIPFFDLRFELIDLVK
jgi:hypothetical protein